MNGSSGDSDLTKTTCAKLKLLNNECGLVRTSVGPSSKDFEEGYDTSIISDSLQGILLR